MEYAGLMKRNPPVTPTHDPNQDSPAHTDSINALFDALNLPNDPLPQYPNPRTPSPMADSDTEVLLSRQDDIY
ncbi:hypothetical protein Dimus_030984, partial [Dionaea muscipula]